MKNIKKGLWKIHLTIQINKACTTKLKAFKVKHKKISLGPTPIVKKISKI